MLVTIDRPIRGVLLALAACSILTPAHGAEEKASTRAYKNTLVRIEDPSPLLADPARGCVGRLCEPTVARNSPGLKGCGRLLSKPAMLGRKALQTSPENHEQSGSCSRRVFPLPLECCRDLARVIH